MPLLLPGQTCQYVTRSSNQVCFQPLDSEGNHPQKCYYGPVQSRHHCIRDALCQMGLQSGWHAGAEQEVVVAGFAFPAANGEAAEQQEPEVLTKRADVVFTTKTGQRLVLDVAVVHSPCTQVRALREKGAQVKRVWYSGLQRLLKRAAKSSTRSLSTQQRFAGLKHWHSSGERLRRAAIRLHRWRYQSNSHIVNSPASCSQRR